MVQKQVEHDKTQVLSTLKSTANALLSGTQNTTQTLNSLDSTIARLRTLKAKMQMLREYEKVIQYATQKRIEHLGQLYDMQSLVDVKFEAWSRTRLNRLLVDYLIRFGFSKTARSLIESKGLGDLTDVPIFEECYRIETSLESDGILTEALAWCVDHKVLMKKEKGNVSWSSLVLIYVMS